MANGDTSSQQPGQQESPKESGRPIDKLPEIIGPYKIEALLDKGGMSDLYLGTHPDTKIPLTIKVLSRKFISNTEVVQRFLNEAEIISMTNHPNIVKMYGHGEWEGGLYIAMEYIEGFSLRKYILQTPISLKRALSIIIDIAYALCHLHTHGVIHRDLKPENILVTEDGRIKVIDFGIAQLLTEKTTARATPRQRLIGTPIYISPEQKENPETVSFPTDIYSLGIVSYELILGKFSHGHIHLSLMPKGMQPILQKCLQADPDDRYQDIVDFITEVSTYLNSPSIEKDKVIGDKLSELSEGFRQMQASLTPEGPPHWAGLDIGVATCRGMKGPLIYFDYFEIEKDTFGMILAEPSSRGADAYLFVANLRGMVHALIPQGLTPSETVATINRLLFMDKLGPIFHLCYLVIKPQEGVIAYVNCSENALWRIPAETKTPTKCPSIGGAVGVSPEVEFKDAVMPLNPGDIVVLNSFAGRSSTGQEELKLDEETFMHALTDHLDHSMQDQTDHLLRRLRLSSREAAENVSITLVAFKAI